MCVCVCSSSVRLGTIQYFIRVAISSCTALVVLAEFEHIKMVRSTIHSNRQTKLKKKALKTQHRKFYVILWCKAPVCLYFCSQKEDCFILHEIFVDVCRIQTWCFLYSRLKTTHNHIKGSSSLKSMCLNRRPPDLFWDLLNAVRKMEHLVKAL